MLDIKGAEAAKVILVIGIMTLHSFGENFGVGVSFVNQRFIEFKVSEKRWYRLKVFALATIRDWDAIEKNLKEKKPPIGYRPFVEACVDADEKGEALKYIPKLTDPRERAKAYARIGMAKEAADPASQSKDGELLGRLKLTFAQNAVASSIF